MEKIQFNIVPMDYTEVSFKDKYGLKQLKITPYISFTQKFLFTKVYLDAFYDKNKSVDERYYYAEQSLALVILDNCTNVQIFSGEEKNEPSSIDIDNIMSSGLWQIIEDKILNYKDLKLDIYAIIDITDRENSLANQAFNFIKDFDPSKIDLEEIKRWTNELKEKNEEPKLTEGAISIEGKPKRIRKPKKGIE